MKRFGVFISVLFIVVWFVTAQPAQAQSPSLPEGPAAVCTVQETSYRSTFTAVKDSYVRSTRPAVNYGTAEGLVVGLVDLIPDGTTTYNTFTAFDLATLPSDAVILTATLELYQTGSTGSAFNMKMQALTGSWTETGVTWDNQPTYTTADEVGSGTLSGDWRQWNITPIVQKWRAGTLVNNGVRLIFDFGLKGSRIFSSREGANPPRLVVEYVRRPTLTVQADTSIAQAYPTQNYGNAVDVFVGRNETTFNENHTLLQFNVSGVPAGSTIISATLILHGTINRALASPQAGIAISPTANLGSWTEMGVTWNSRPGDESQGDPSSTFVDGGFTYWNVTNIVQAWNSGALLNYGFRLKPANGELGSASLVAREGSPDPQLIITYGPPPCYPATSVAINGATAGNTNTPLPFEANILPSTATPPILYTWRADEQSTFEGYVGAITYTWATTGTKTITVTASNCESSVVDTHQVVISAPSACIPVTNLSVSGPTEGITNTEYTFTADASPDTATKQVYYTWEADEQTPSTGGAVIKYYTWLTPGTKHITVTVSNCSGAAVIVRYHTIDVVPRDQLPDIVVSGMWYNLDEARVYYITKNIGGSAAPAPFNVDLTRAITVVAQTAFPEILQPGWVRSRYIDYVWNCADMPPGTSALRALVTADSGNVVLEGNEANNSFEDWWLCDLYPPEIIAGPIITVTEYTAQITWTTNKPTRTDFDYGRNGPFNVTTISDFNYRTEHQVSLSDLDHASVYWYRIRFTDEQGLLNATAGDYFETEPPGTDPATLGVIGLSEYPSTTYEFWTLYADITSDVAGVDRVSFFLDGQLIGRDFTPSGTRYEVYVSPAALGLTRAEWFTFHDLQVQAYNLENEVTAEVGSVKPTNRPMPGEANLVSPSSGKQIYIDGTVAPAGTSLNVLVYGEQYMWECTETAYTEGVVPPGMNGVACSNVMQNLKTMRLYLDGAQVGTYTPGVGTYNHWFEVNLTGKGLGDHTLRFEAETTGGSIFTDESTIKLVQGRGDINIGHTATRSGNVIQVTLFISNTGTGTAYVDYVEDFARGFQVIETSNQLGLMAPAANYYVVTNGDYGDTPNRKIMVDLYSDADNDEIVLGPGASFAVTYKLVPILYQEWDYYYIGSGHGAEQAAWVGYRYEGVGGTFRQEFREGDNWVDGVWIDTVVQQMIAGSDYILVTSPGGLRYLTSPIDWRASQGTQRELGILLSRMAELASLQQGVLGFLPINPCPTTLDALLEPGGRWANAMHPDFRGYEATGYVLFVGEDEIIPPQAAGYKTTYSDLRYASTSGQAKPELILGRIVGPDLGTLSNALRTSIMFHKTGFGFDRSHAVGASGTDEDSDREFDIFWGDIKSTASTFASSGGFNVTKIRWATDNDPTEFDVLADVVEATSPDVIFYSGHGSPGGWSGLWTSYIPLLNFGLSRPIGLSFACSTGDYRDSYSMPEAWLRYNGSVFIGSTSSTYDYPDSNAIRKMASYWPLSAQDRNIGQVFTYIKRDKWPGDSEWRMFAYQYHLFGDPKYGAITTLAQSSSTLPALPMATEPVTMLQVTIPDFEVTVTGTGLDAVEIPGGETWGKAYEYRVPYWIESVNYAPGQRVQDVVLTAQAGLVITTGLHLPTTTPEIRCPDCASLASTAAVTPTWFPVLEKPYRWQITENPDGSSTLDVTIYPFYYYSPTTDVRFYKDWSFDVDVFTTTVDIASLNLTQATYRLTETVAATLVVNNSGVEQPVIVQPVVKSLSEDLETELPLRVLHAITGTSMLDLVITETLAAGDYILDVTLLDMESHVLDTEVTEFTVGVAAGEVTGLTATPTSFDPGDDIALTMTFQNTGDVTLDGVAVIRVQTGDGVAQTAEFTHTLATLAPGATATFNDIWDSTGAISETYRVVGYVTYNLGVSVPQEMILSTGGYNIYLPLVLRSSN